MDNKAPKRKGPGRSTISQIRPEVLVARNEGVELDQPWGPGDLEKFVQSNEQEPVLFGKEGNETARITKLKCRK